MTTTITRRFTVFACAVVLGGCSVVPIYHRPDVPLPRSWATPTTAQNAPAAALPAAQWWRSFNSPELNALVAQGLAQGFDLRVALSRVEQARGRAQIAGAAGRPAVDAGVSINHGSGTGNNTRSVSALASFELDFWGRNHAVAQSAEALANASQFDADTVRITLVASIVDNYFQVLSLDERIGIAQFIAEDAQRILSLVEKQAELGATSQLEVAQQRNALQSVQALLPLLLRERVATRNQLAVLIGVPPQGFSIVHAGFSGISIPVVAAAVPADVMQNRPDIRAAEERLRAANFDIGAARAAFYPSVSLSAQIGHSFSPPAALWNVGASLLQPLFDAGQREGQLRVDRAHAEELVASYRQTVIQALQDVENQLDSTQNLDAADRLGQAALNSAQEAQRLARIRYERGATDFLSLLTAERTRFQSEDSLAQVRLQKLQAIVGLYRALGGGAFAADAPAASIPSVPSSRG